MLVFDHSTDRFSKHSMWCLLGKQAIFNFLLVEGCSVALVHSTKLYAKSQNSAVVFLLICYSTLYSRLAVRSFIFTLPPFSLHPFLQDFSPAQAIATHHCHWKSLWLIQHSHGPFSGSIHHCAKCLHRCELIILGFFTIFVTNNLHVKINLFKKMSAAHSNKATHIV